MLFQAFNSSFNMESDSTVRTTSPLQSNDSMPPTPNSVENSSANSPTNHHYTTQSNKQPHKRDVTVLTNQPIMTSQSNRRRHYSSASSSADEDVDVVNENTKKSLSKHLNKKLNSSGGNAATECESISNRSKLKSHSPFGNQKSSLNSSTNGSIDAKSIRASNGASATTILHSPNSNNSSSSQFDGACTQTSMKADSAAALIANLDAEQASRKFKSFLIEDILSQQQKKQQQILLLQQQQLLLQQFNNSKLLQQQQQQQQQQSTPLSPSTAINQSSPNPVHSLVNNSDTLNDSMRESMNVAAMAANMAYNSLTNSIIRPWDLTNSLANSLTNGLIPNSAAAATLSQLTSQSALNGQSASLPAGLSSALTLGTNVQTNASSQPPHLNNHHQSTNHLQNGSSLLQLNNQAAMAALAATQSSNNNKLNVQQLQQLTRFGGLNYPHLVSAGNFASSLGHLSAHHQFLAGLNGTAAGLFPNLSNLTQNAALSAALKNDPTFRLHSLAHSFTTGANLPTGQSNASTTDASLMQHLINSTSNATAASGQLAVNGQPTNPKSSSNVNSNKQSKQSINENGKRLNVEDLDDECEDYDNDTLMNDDDCDDKCSVNSSTNGQTKTKPNGTNGDNSSPLSALYELANKNFEMTRTEKSGKLCARIFPFFYRPYDSIDY